MTNTPDHTPLFVSLFITVVGLAVLLTARPIWTLQIRTLERHLDWYRHHPTLGANFFRFFGGMFFLIGIATFFQH